MQPGATVKRRPATHPIGMIIENKQVERFSQLPHEGERDVMKIARADKSEGRLVWLARLASPERFFESFEVPETAV